MLTYKDIRNALNGSFLLAKGDSSGLKYFDADLDGFWRSFLVVLPIAPFYVLFAMQENQITHELNSESAYLATGAGFVASKIALLLLDWLVFPIAMIIITRLLVVWPKYVPYIAVYNWSSLFIIGILVPPALLFALGIISAQTATFINMLFAFFVLYFRWYIARTVLETETLVSTLIVAFDLVLSLLIHGLFTRIIGYFATA